MSRDVQSITSSAEDNCVIARDVVKVFGSGARSITALRGASLRVEAGRLVVLAGPSGCGKTTLLSIISGMLRPSAGRVSVFGVDWWQYSEDQRGRLRGRLVGYVFQRFHMIPTLPVLYNVAVPLLARGIARRAALDRAAEALAGVGLERRLGAMPAELSGGMQQRVAIARALVGRPRLLVCDEPTANLDSRTGREVMQLIHAASRATDERGAACSVIVVTHDYQVMRFADEIHEMADGAVLPASPRLLERVRVLAGIHDDLAPPETVKHV